MVSLYIKESCPYCKYVLENIEGISIELDLKDASKNEKYAKEVEKLGGKVQYPFLVDENRHISMYESRDIVDYLQKTYFFPEEKKEFAEEEVDSNESDQE